MSLFGKIKKLLEQEETTGKAKELTLREGTAEMHFFVAAATLQKDVDLDHGMSHLAELLAFDPGRREWLDLLDRYLERVDADWQPLLPEMEQRYFATEAVRALLWAREGKLEDALRLWLSVVRVKPDARYLETWALQLLEPAGAMESLPDDVAMGLFATILNAYPEHRYATAARRRELVRFVKLAKRLRLESPRSDAVDMLIAGLHRKAGLFAEGLDYLRDAANTRSSWHLSVAQGLLHREMNNTVEARTAFDEALRFDPEALSTRLEVADMYFRLEDWARAREWYGQVLSVEPEHAWAHPSALWCEWRLRSEAPFPDESFPEELVTLANDAGNARASELVSRFSAYWGYLPEPRDATANVVRQVRESYDPNEPSGRPPAEIKITVSDVEAPSNTIALRQAMESLGLDVRLVLACENVANPDPREPVEPVRYRLWRRDGEHLVPALPPPPRDVAAAIGNIARAPFDRRVNWASASVVAEELGSSAVEPILACIVHPPSPPEDHDALLWVPRAQLAATDTLAHIDDGWEDSVRRSALYSILLGPRDWSTESAVLTLTRLAGEYEVIAPDVHEAFTKLREARPDSGYVCYEHALFTCWLELPHLFPEEREDLEAELNRIEEALSD